MIKHAGDQDKELNTANCPILIVKILYNCRSEIIPNFAATLSDLFVVGIV